MDNDSVEENDSSCDVELRLDMHKVFLANKRKRKAKAEEARERAEHNRIFKSHGTVEEKLQELLPQEDFNWTDSKWNKVNKWQDIANAYLTDMRKEANSNQLAVAIAATLQFR